MSEILKITGLSKSYSSKQNKNLILDNLNFSLKKGEIAAIIGPSGSGKSSFLHIAGLLDKFDSGEIYIDSENVTNYNNSKLDQIRKTKLSFIYQFHYLMPDFTLLENIEIISKLKYGKFNKEEIMTLIEEFELTDKINNLPSELSGGQQQRVAILRAIIEKPLIIMADEPTGNLDPTTANKIMDLFIKKCKKDDISAMIVTHNPDIARKLDNIYELKDKTLSLIKSSI